MKYPNITACLAVVLLASAAPANAETSSESNPQSAPENQWSDTLESLQAYTAEQRDKALQAGKETLDAMDRRLEKMEAWTKKHWNSLSEETREERAAAMKELREQRNEAAEWYGAMKHGSAEAWDTVKQGFIDSYDKLQSSYNAAVESSDGEGGTSGD